MIAKNENQLNSIRSDLDLDRSILNNRDTAKLLKPIDNKTNNNNNGDGGGGGVAGGNEDDRFDSNTTATIGTNNEIVTKRSIRRGDEIETAIEEEENKQLFVRKLCLMRWPDGVSGFSTYEFL
ncbi:hypothetical protein QR98_0055740 [Sarcoptes scabiei]|uniref:Uncharacterized protein n=1 Tax=Sarcoptes scabiei TaxID=52283 RepID=A0A132A9G6_SARSC|nr:hypothetical protein QR98_0055740 [Sarcoptes scabiei]